MKRMKKVEIGSTCTYEGTLRDLLDTLSKLLEQHPDAYLEMSDEYEETHSLIYTNVEMTQVEINIEDLELEILELDKLISNLIYNQPKRASNVKHIVIEGNTKIPQEVLEAIDSKDTTIDYYLDRAGTRLYTLSSESLEDYEVRALGYDNKIIEADLERTELRARLQQLKGGSNE